MGGGGNQTNYDYAGRVQRARKLLQTYQLDGLYVVSGPVMRYFTGYSAYEGGWPIWLSAFILPREGAPVLLISNKIRSVKVHFDTPLQHSGAWKP